MTRMLLLMLPIAVAGCGRIEANPRGLEKGETLLSVSGTGRAESRPDQAMFTAGLENIADTQRIYPITDKLWW